MSYKPVRITFQNVLESVLAGDKIDRMVEMRKKRKNTPISVYLTKEEKTEIQTLADLAGISKHGFMQSGLRWFVKEYKKDSGILKESLKETPD